VKKPNNYKGIKDESERMDNKRFKNNKFRKFINITQLLVFSNNMEYDDTGIDQLQGAFYATTSKNKVYFNNFREELKNELPELPEINDETENFISRLYKVISNLLNHESARCHYKAIDLRLPRQMIILNLM
jgi:type I restriction enzyme R subunit